MITYLFLLLQFLGVPASWLFPAADDAAETVESRDREQREGGGRRGERGQGHRSASTNRGDSQKATEQPTDDISNGF